MWDSYALSRDKPGCGSVSQAARGRWHANPCLEVPVFVGPVKPPEISKCVGIDPGLKDVATLSDGVRIAAQRLYGGAEAKLAVAQRANKKPRIKALHAHIASRRKAALDKRRTHLVRHNRAIFVGNVNACALAKTTMAKSVPDAGWTTLRTMPRYQSITAGVLFGEVNAA